MRTNQEQEIFPLTVSRAPIAGQAGPPPAPVGAAARVNAAILALTLGFGALAMALLAQTAGAVRSPWGAAGALLYGVTLEASALCSFLYNLHHGGRRRRVLRQCDHAAIFLLIGGTYTPLAIIGLPQPLGAYLLGAVWSLAALGILLKLCLDESFDRLFVAYYLGVGLVVLGVLDQVMRAMAAEVVTLIIAGGIAYVVGAVIYARDLGRWTDAVWHALVLVGAASHFAAIQMLLRQS